MEPASAGIVVDQFLQELVHFVELFQRANLTTVFILLRTSISTLQALVCALIDLSTVLEL